MHNLILDHADGASIFNYENKDLVIAQPELVSLDIVHAKQLESLQLCVAKHTRHIAIRGTEKLSVISSTTESAPLILHLYTKGFPAYLQINTPVQHIDIDWQKTQLTNGQTQAYISAKHTWPAVTILRSDSPMLQPTLEQAGSDDLIMLEIIAGHSEPDLQIKTNAHLILFNTVGISSLTITKANSVYIDHSDGELKKITTDTQKLAINACPNVECISVPSQEVLETLLTKTGCAVEVRQNQHTNLSIHGACGELRLKDVTTQNLNFNQCDSLHAHNCKALKNITGTFPNTIKLTGIISNAMLHYSRQQFTESILKYNIGNITAPDDPTLTTLLERIPQQSEARSISQALLILERAAIIGVPIENIWELRCKLSKNHLKQNGRWHWNIKGDGVAEAWNADFRLWAYAIEKGIQEANRLTQQIARSITNCQHGMHGIQSLLYQNREILSLNTWEKIWRSINKAQQKTSGAFPSQSECNAVSKLTKIAINYFQPMEHTQSLRQDIIRYCINATNCITAKKLLPILLNFNRAATRLSLMRRAKEIQNRNGFGLFSESGDTASCYLQLALGKVKKEKTLEMSNCFAMHDSLRRE